MSRARFFGIQVLQKLFTIWLIVTLLFFFFRLMPGSYVDLMALGGAGEEAIQTVVERWRLDEPIYIQYLYYMRNLLTGDMGNSLQYGIPVWDYVKFKILNTAILAVPAITAAYVVGSGLGTLIGFNRDTNLEKGSIIGATFLGTIPEFFFSILVIVIFAGWLNLLPTSGMLGPGVAATHQGAAWWRPYFTESFLLHYILPFSVVFLRLLYFPTLLMRTSVVETMNQPFTYYHRIKGLSEIKRMRHLAKHSILPVFTIYPVSLVRAISGLVLIEMVFNWPGIGFALLQAVLSRDFPVIMFIFFLTATFIVLANFAVDILYGVVDPRISVGDQS